MNGPRRTLVLGMEIFGIQSRGGISTVWGEYLKRLPRVLDPEWSIVLALPRHSCNAVLEELELSRAKSYQVRHRSRRGTLTKYLPYLTRTGDLLHMSYYGWYPLFPNRVVVTVHDFTHERYGRGVRRIAHRWLMRRAISRAAAVVCVSESTKQDLLQFNPGIEATKIVDVIPNGVGEDFYEDVDPKRDDEAPYMLWVGERSWYKNFSGGLDFLALAREEMTRLRLVVVGPRFTKKEFRAIRRAGLENAVQLETSVDTSRLRRLYSQAHGLLYLSRYEGFGLPILEAQRCGCPVVCLSTPATRETGGESVLYIEEPDRRSCDDVLRQLQAESDNRARLVRDGRRNAQRFNWDESAQRLARLYDALVSEDGRSPDPRQSGADGVH